MHCCLRLYHDQFASVGMAYEIFELDHVFQVSDPTLRFKFHALKNGSPDQPRVGDLLIWRGGAL